MVHPLLADSTLSIAIAAVGSFAALMSVVIAALVQQDIVRERRRQRFGSAIEHADDVRWAANNDAHLWGKPLGNYKSSYAILPRSSRRKLSFARDLSEHEGPSKDPKEFGPEANEVEELAIKAVDELRSELAKLR